MRLVFLVITGDMGARILPGDFARAASAFRLGFVLCKKGDVGMVGDERGKTMIRADTHDGVCFYFEKRWNHSSWGRVARATPQLSSSAVTATQTVPCSR